MPFKLQHWPLVVILGLAGVLIFTALGRDHLWSDEGDTAVLGRNILLTGVPTAWDGKTFTDSDYGARLNDDLVMVSSPWLQYYLAAASLAVFGETAFAARFPFALLGLVTIVLAYVLAWQVTRHRWTAATAALLLMLSVQFLIYARQSRHYTLHAALTCLLVLQFTRLSSWRGTAVFALTAVLLFHSHPLGLAPLLAMGALTVVAPAFRAQRPWFWRAMVPVALLTLPWFVFARSGYALNTGFIRSAEVFLPRLLQFAVEVGSVTSVIGVALLYVLLRRRARKGPPPVRGKGRRPSPRPPVFAADQGQLLIVLLATMSAYALVMAVTQPRDVIFTVGLRYTPAVLPFMAVIAALLIARASGGQWRPWLAMVLVFGVTKVGRVTPWVFWEEHTPRRDPNAVVTFHNPERLVDRVFRTGQIEFVRSLFTANPGTTGRVVEFLKQNAAPNDVVLTNYGWEPLYFHTGLPQAMTVLPTYPIYRAAREKQLPEYVFRPDQARWIVWRRAWGTYRGQALHEVLANLESSGAQVRLITAVPETLWENRENVHFRRFTPGRYVYPWFRDLPDTLIFRIDGPPPGGAGGGGGASAG